MKKQLAILNILAFLSAPGMASVLGTESGASWTTATWTNGAVGSIGTWYQVVNPGSSLAIGDSSQGGRTSIGAQAFNVIPGSYTNANLGFARTFFVFDGGALSEGQSLSFDINFLFSNGTKGFTLEKTGGGVGSDLFTVWQDWGDPVVALGSLLGAPSTILANGFQQALTLNATQLSGAIQISVLNNSSSIFSQTFTTTDTIGQIQFFAGNIDPTQEGSAASQSIYANNIAVVPEPSTYALLAMTGALLAGYRLRRRNR